MSIRESKFFRTAYYLCWLLLLFISRLLKSIWLFFPGMLFIILAMWCFWSLNQGKDLIVAFTENDQAKTFFFIAIAFWAYVSWYSARIVAYLKKSKQEERIGKIMGECTPEEASKTLSNTQVFELPPVWLQTFPHIIGFACLLTIELAVLQSPVLGADAISSSKAGLFFLLGMAICWGLDSRIKDFANNKLQLSRLVFYILLGIFLAAAIVVIMSPKASILSLLWVLLLLHAVFIMYINLRKKKPATNNKPANPFILIRWMYGIMDFLRIPRIETGYFGWFNIVAAAGLAVYLLAIRSINVSWDLGPFPLVLLGFAVLLGFGNMITALSVKTNINLHFIVFIIAMLLGSKETHYVRTQSLDTAKRGIYDQRQDVLTYFKNWINDRGAAIDSAKDGYPVYFALANGGASRSGYWTASVLGSLEDATAGSKDPFSRHVFCLSGTSGGGVGVATFFSQLYDHKRLAPTVEASYLTSARLFLKQDFLTHTMAHMLGPDYFKYIFHINNDDLSDRTGALEETFEAGAKRVRYPLRAAMDEPFSNMLALRNQPYDLPILCINTTRMQDGNPAVVTNIRLSKDIFNNREDVMDLLNDSLDIHLSTASILGARFPYISPAGRIDQWLSPAARVKPSDSVLVHYFVDGGYFDNSGAGVVQEMMRAVLNYADTTTDLVLKRRVRKLQLTILHITNSPVGVAPLTSVTPLKNDLSSPLLTIMGAYDMQTTVNDKRLINFLKDVDRDSVCQSATYYPIHLYRDAVEKQEARKRGDTLMESPYAMNWFISDTTLKRMDERLIKQPKLNELINKIKQ